MRKTQDKRWHRKSKQHIFLKATFKKEITTIMKEEMGVKTIGGTKRKSIRYWNGVLERSCETKNKYFRQWMKLRTPKTRKSNVQQ